MAERGGTTFGPEQVVLINTAYAEALQHLGIHASFVERRALLAKIIMDLARQGETDAARLRDTAVAAVRKFDWIRKQAHDLWESEGRPQGRDKVHWAQAEHDFEARKDETS